MVNCWGYHLNIYSSKSFVPLTVLISLYFKIPIHVKSKKNDLIKLTFSDYVLCTHDCYFCAKPLVLRNGTILVQKPHFWHKNAKEQQLCVLIMWLYCKIWALPHRLNPSIVETRKVKSCKFHYYFDQQTLSINTINFQKIWGKCEYSTSVAKLFEEYRERDELTLQ